MITKDGKSLRDAKRVVLQFFNITTHFFLGIRRYKKNGSSRLTSRLN